MSGKSANDINADKVTYLLGLLGRNRTEKELNSSTADSDYEDIEDLKMLTLESMITRPPISEDTYISDTTVAQDDVSEVIEEIYQEVAKTGNAAVFETELHTQYVQRSLFNALPWYYRSLDANHGWMLYWLVNFKQLLPTKSGNPEPIAEEISKLVTEKINSVIIDGGLGGIAGGKNQIGHAASTYASVLALILVEDYETLNRIRPNLYIWIMKSLRNGPDSGDKYGSFSMHPHGESDTRSTYCVLVIASLLNILTDELCEGTAEWIARCQTFEGGFAGVPLTEAHGGYTFCALASYFFLLGKSQNEKNGDLEAQILKYIDIDGLLHWTAMRQYQLEGGLSGRTNKLVDACYSFWIGGVFPLLEMVLDEESLFDREALKIYILNCCQDSRGGLRDKPGKLPDFYHLNYTALGLCVAENTYSINKEKKTGADKYAYKITSNPVSENVQFRAINPIFGLPIGYAERCKEHFIRLDCK